MINFTLLSIPQLENIVRTARNQAARSAAQEELESRQVQMSGAGTLPLFPSTSPASHTSHVTRH